MSSVGNTVQSRSPFLRGHTVEHGEPGEVPSGAGPTPPLGVDETPGPFPLAAVTQDLLPGPR